MARSLGLVNFSIRINGVGWGLKNGVLESECCPKGEYRGQDLRIDSEKDRSGDTAL
jgi:hypothetical protein